MNNAAVLICTIAMLFLYLLEARKARAHPGHDDPDRFFLSNGCHTKEEYGATQTAYFLQMATVYPFFLFGFSHQWWLGVWNTIFYIVGILVFMFVLPRCNRGILDMVGRSSTPHALIANAHDMKFLRKFASFLSITAFVGLALFETVWGTAALKAVLGGNTTLYYLSIAVFALYLVSVLWTGGQRAAIRTAQYQLLIAYIALHLLTAWALYRHDGDLALIDAPVLFPVIFLTGSVAVFRRLRHVKQDGTRLMRILNLGAVVSLLAVLAAIVRAPNFFSLQTLTMKPIELPEYGGLMLFTMACLPIFFQFVDMTNWQRLSSLSGKDDQVIRDAKSGLRFFILESPLSWLFPIAIGMSALTFLTLQEGEDPWVGFVNLVTTLPGFWGGLIAVAVVVGVLCIFLSTADALLSASGYAWAYDVNPKSREIMDRVHFGRNGDKLTQQERMLVVHSGNFATTVAILTAALIYIVGDAVWGFGGRLLGIFLAFYSPMLAFAPSMLMPILTGRAAGKYWALISMVVSALLGLGIGFWSIFSTNGIWAWLGVPVCFVISWSIYLFGFLVSARPIRDSVSEAAGVA